MGKKVKITFEVDNNGKIIPDTVEVKDGGERQIAPGERPDGVIKTDWIEINRGSYWIYIGGKWYKIG